MPRNRLIVSFLRGEGRAPFEIGAVLNGTKLAKGITKALNQRGFDLRLSRLEFSSNACRGVYYLLERDGGKYSKNRLPEFNAPTTCKRFAGEI